MSLGPQALRDELERQLQEELARPPSERTLYPETIREVQGLAEKAVHSLAELDRANARRKLRAWQWGVSGAVLFGVGVGTAQPIWVFAALGTLVVAGHFATRAD